MMKISQKVEFLIFVCNSSMTSSNMVSKIKFIIDLDHSAHSILLEKLYRKVGLLSSVRYIFIEI